MSWSDKLKEAGVNIHVTATGGGAGLQRLLWEVPGSSAYLSGATFPYDQDEQAELLGFMPEHFCSEEAAIDLASAAYMKAFKFGGKKAVGIGITASVASEKMHRGDHRVFVCAVTDTKIQTGSITLEKGVGQEVRVSDGRKCDYVGEYILFNALGIDTLDEHLYEGSRKIFNEALAKTFNLQDATEKAKARFFERPFFTANGKRLAKVPQEAVYAMMPGSFNPPHEGHFGLAREFRHEHAKNVLFEIGTNPPHKAPPTVQELLQRAKMLKGYDVLFSRDMPMYVEKAAMFHGMPFIVGADTMLRILDPKWGIDPIQVMNDIWGYGNEFYVAGREVNGEFVTRDDIVFGLPKEYMNKFGSIIHSLEGRWDVSSTELRNKK